MMEIRNATQGNYNELVQQELIVAIENDSGIALLRWGYFWESIPFMNILTVVEHRRGQGIGTALVTCREKALREHGQFLYRKLGYRDCGALLFPHEPLEIIMRKVIA